jgi:hypothetical protein
MEAKDITKGKTEIIELQHKYKIGKRFSIEIDGIPTIEVKTAIGFHSDEEVKANAELICEAFNVANETGLSPRQMQERIKELELQAKKLIQWETDYPPQRIYGMSQTITIAKELEKIILNFKKALNK